MPWLPSKMRSDPFGRPVAEGGDGRPTNELLSRADERLHRIGFDQLGHFVGVGLGEPGAVGPAAVVLVNRYELVFRNPGVGDIDGVQGDPVQVPLDGGPESNPARPVPVDPLGCSVPGDVERGGHHRQRMEQNLRFDWIQDLTFHQRSRRKDRGSRQVMGRNSEERGGAVVAEGVSTAVPNHRVPNLVAAGKADHQAGVGRLLGQMIDREALARVAETEIDHDVSRSNRSSRSSRACRGCSAPDHHNIDSTVAGAAVGTDTAAPEGRVVPIRVLMMTAAIAIGSSS